MGVRYLGSIVVAVLVVIAIAAAEIVRRLCDSNAATAASIQRIREQDESAQSTAAQQTDPVVAAIQSVDGKIGALSRAFIDRDQSLKSMIGTLQQLTEVLNAIAIDLKGPTNAGA